MLILASASPQRRALLRQIGIEPVVVPTNIEENLDVRDLAGSLKDLARQKVEAALARLKADGREATLNEECWIIGADTVVVAGSDILGKPADREDARRMLKSLSGMTHQVVTGVFTGKIHGNRHRGLTVSRHITDVARTAVSFNSLSDREISRYLASEEWRDAAGAYRIQGKGACIVAGINGSFSNVVGLPLERIYGMLLRLGYKF